MIKYLQGWRERDPREMMIAALGLLIVGSTVLALYTDHLFLLGMPAVALLIFLAVVDVKKVFWLLLFSIPLSVEVPISSSLATDLPTEPLTVLLMGIGFLLLLKKGGEWR